MSRILILTLCLLVASATVLHAQDPAGAIGFVKSVTGEAVVVRGGRQLPATPGFQLFKGDVLTTGPAGAMAIVLRDETAISLGASTETSVEEFAYDPQERKLGMVVRLARGMMAYLSGKISKLAPGAVRVETPVATLGVRGTYFVAKVVP